MLNHVHHPPSRSSNLNGVLKVAKWLFGDYTIIDVTLLVISNVTECFSIVVHYTVASVHDGISKNRRTKV